ncbi:hypothetical protein LIA77_03510 [Sarocladium implicatum]|nr:hypothetical protein LIA77_03510 [Sarocladium implicatum]
MALESRGQADKKASGTRSGGWRSNRTPLITAALNSHIILSNVYSPHSLRCVQRPNVWVESGVTNWHQTHVRPRQAMNMVPQRQVSGNRAFERPHSLARNRVRALDLELEGTPVCASGT